MKKILTSLMLIGLVVFGFILPSNNASAAENTPLVDKVQITSIGNNEYIDYGQGKKYRVYAYKNTTFKGYAYDANGAFEGSVEMPSGKGNYSFWASRSTHYYDIVNLGYYNGPNKTNQIPKANEKTVYHYSHGVYHP
ncbi:hypothetical protein ACWGJ1_10660 [Bacillus wiedmannii]|uniref:hypothetical protein n=1 Tax=Bacillus wiedmannii TaxID=1890302 RepID=UPI0035DA5808